jgi:hypothetical protein
MTTRRAQLGLVLALCGCGEGLESVYIESICTDEARPAILVAVAHPDGLTVDSVKVMHGSEKHCYLASAPRGYDAGEADGPDAAQYLCLEQGQGTYVVRVTSGKRTWTQSVEITGDECHVTNVAKLTFELK